MSQLETAAIKQAENQKAGVFARGVTAIYTKSTIEVRLAGWRCAWAWVHACMRARACVWASVRISEACGEKEGSLATAARPWRR